MHETKATGDLAGAHTQHGFLKLLLTLFAGVAAILMLTQMPVPASVRAFSLHQHTSQMARSRQLNTVRGEVYLLSCMAFLSQDMLQPALRACDHAIDLNPHDAQALRLRGSIYLMLGDTERAVVDFSLSIEFEPANAAGYALRGRALFDLHRYDAAVDDFGAAIARDPKNADTFGARGFAFQALRRYNEAIADFGDAIALAPDNASAWNARCWVRMLANTQLHAALSDCLQAVKLDPAVAHPFDSLGWVYMRLGDPQQALRSFNAALSKSPRLAPSLYGRGLAKMALGEFADGQRDIAAARALEPDIVRRFGSYGLRPPGVPIRPKNRPDIEEAS